MILSILLCDKLIVLNVELCKFTAMFRYHELLIDEKNDIDKQLLENEAYKFRDKALDTEKNEKEFLSIKIAAS